MRIQRHPHFSDKLLVFDSSSPMGDGKVVDATPTMLNAMNQIELQAAMSTAMPKGDHATLAHFVAESQDRSPRAFRQWLTLNQVPTRQALQIKLEARAHGLDLAEPPVEPPMERDPRDRTARPLADTEDDYNYEPHTPVPVRSLAPGEKYSEGLTFSDLERIGVLRPGMSEAEFDARLRAVQITDPSVRMRLTAAAYQRGYFQRGAVPGAVRLPGSPNGSQTPTATMRPAETVSVRPERRSTRIDNLSASQDAQLRDLQASVERLQRHVFGPRKGRSLSGRAEQCDA